MNLLGWSFVLMWPKNILIPGLLNYYLFMCTYTLFYYGTKHVPQAQTLETAL